MIGIMQSMRIRSYLMCMKLLMASWPFSAWSISRFMRFRIMVATRMLTSLSSQRRIFSFGESFSSWGLLVMYLSSW